MTEFVCFVCNQPIADPDGRHDCHESDCPNYTGSLVGECTYFDCDCDLPCHPECCPACDGTWLAEEERWRAPA